MDWYFDFNPFEDRKIFHRKLTSMTQSRLEEEVAKSPLNEYDGHFLKCQLALLKKPEYNVRITFNRAHGLHLSSCLQSAPHLYEQYKENSEPCTCEDDFKDPEAYFARLDQENLSRCILCKYVRVGNSGKSRDIDTEMDPLREEPLEEKN